MMYGYFQGIPTELDESAGIDGAGRVQIFLRVAMPLALPGVAAIFLYASLPLLIVFIFLQRYLVSRRRR